MSTSPASASWKPRCSVFATPSSASSTVRVAGAAPPGHPRARTRRRAASAASSPCPGTRARRRPCRRRRRGRDRPAVPPQRGHVAGEPEPDLGRHRRREAERVDRVAEQHQRRRSAAISSARARWRGDVRLEVLGRASAPVSTSSTPSTAERRSANRSGSWSITATRDAAAGSALSDSAALISSSDTSRSSPRRALGDDEDAAHPLIRSFTISAIRSAIVGAAAEHLGALAAPPAAPARAAASRPRPRSRPRRGRARRRRRTSSGFSLRLLDRPQVRVARLVDPGLDRQQRRQADAQALDQAALELASTTTADAPAVVLERLDDGDARQVQIARERHPGGAVDGVAGLHAAEHEVGRLAARPRPRARAPRRAGRRRQAVVCQTRTRAVGALRQAARSASSASSSPTVIDDDLAVARRLAQLAAPPRARTRPTR